MKGDEIISWISEQPERKSRIFENEYLAEHRKRFNSELTFSGKEMALKIKKGSEVSPLVLRPTGSPELDQIFQFPANRVGVVYGPSSGGKSTLLIEHVAFMQSIDPKFTCLLVAAESMDGISDGYYSGMGVDMDRLDVIETGDVPPMEELFDALLGSNKMAAKVGAVEAHLKRFEGAIFKEYDLVIIDSSDGLSARQEYLDSKNKNRGVANDNPGVKARKWSEGLRRICGALDNLDSALYIVCQTRANIGGYGALTAVTGGNAIKYYSSFRLAVKRGDPIESGPKDNKVKEGYYRKVVLEKTKISGNELQEVECPFIFGKGLDQIIGLFNASLGSVITMSGSWFYSDIFPEAGAKSKRSIQGRESAVQFLRDNESAVLELSTKLDEYEQQRHNNQTDVRVDNTAESAEPAISL